MLKAVQPPERPFRQGGPGRLLPELFLRELASKIAEYPGLGLAESIYRTLKQGSRPNGVLRKHNGKPCAPATAGGKVETGRGLRQGKSGNIKNIDLVSNEVSIV